MTGGTALAPAERAGLRLGVLAVSVLALTCVVLPLGFLAREQWDPMQRLDVRLSDGARELVVASDVLRVAAQLLTHLGAPLALELAAAVLVVALLRAGHGRSALFLAVSIAGAYTLSATGKAVVDRARPAFEDPVSVARGAAFPSGHATGAAAFWLALALVLPVLVHVSRRLLLVAAVAVPVVVAVTRVLLGVHYPTDVVAGLVLGWGWVAACAAVFVAWRSDEGDPGDGVLEDGVEPA